MFFFESDREKLNQLVEKSVVDSQLIEEFFLSVQSINCAIKGIEKDIIDMRRDMDSINLSFSMTTKNILGINTFLNSVRCDIATIKEIHNKQAKKEVKPPRKTRTKKNDLPH